MKYVFTFLSVFILNLFFFTSIAQKDACGTTTSVTYEGGPYATVAIGTQCWLKQNLNVGTKIPGATSGGQTNNSIIEKFCYNDDDLNCATYGGLYQWAEMVKYFRGATNNTSMNPLLGTSLLQGICPPSWHIPTFVEWKTLFTFLDGSYNYASNNVSPTVGGKLKEAGTSHWNSPNTGADNSSLFTAFGAGYHSGSSFMSLKTQEYFASVDDIGYQSKFAYVVSNSANGVIDTDIKSYALSVRCIKGNGIDMGSGIENTKLDLNEILDVFPNPANQILNFNFKKHQTEELHIFIINSVGEPVFSKLITKENFALNNTIKIEKLPAGNYFFKLESNNKIYSKKIIIQRK